MYLHLKGLETVIVKPFSFLSSPHPSLHVQVGQYGK